MPDDRSTFLDGGVQDQTIAIEPHGADLIAADPRGIQGPFDPMHDRLAIAGDLVRAEVRDVSNVGGPHLLRVSFAKRHRRAVRAHHLAGHIAIRVVRETADSIAIGTAAPTRFIHRFVQNKPPRPHETRQRVLHLRATAAGLIHSV